MARGAYNDPRMRIYRRGAKGTYWLQWRGKRISLGVTDRAAAELAARDIQRRAADPTYAAARTRTLAELCEAYLADAPTAANRARPPAEATLEMVGYHLGHFDRLLGGEREIASLTREREALSALRSACTPFLRAWDKHKYGAGVSLKHWHDLAKALGSEREGSLWTTPAATNVAPDPDIEIGMLREELTREREAHDALRVAAENYFDEHGAEHEEPDCPEDDTCRCQLVVALNDAARQPHHRSDRVRNLRVRDGHRRPSQRPRGTGGDQEALAPTAAPGTTPGTKEPGDASASEPDGLGSGKR